MLHLKRLSDRRYRIEAGSVQRRASAGILLLAILFTPSAQGQTPSFVSPADARAAGLRSYYQGDFERAERVLAEGLKQFPADPDLLLDLAWVYYEMGNYVASLDAATQASLNNSQRLNEIYRLISLNYFHNLSLIDTEEQLRTRPPEDVERYMAFADSAEDGDQLWYMLGATNVKMGDTVAAWNAFLGSIRHRWDYVEPAFYMARLYQAADNPSMAALIYARAIIAEPDAPYLERYMIFLENNLLRSTSGSEQVLITPSIDVDSIGPMFRTIVSNYTPVANQPDSLITRYYLKWYHDLIEQGYLDSFVAQLVSTVDDSEERRAWMEQYRPTLQRYHDWLYSYYGLRSEK